MEKFETPTPTERIEITDEERQKQYIETIQGYNAKDLGEVIDRAVKQDNDELDRIKKEINDEERQKQYTEKIDQYKKDMKPIKEAMENLKAKYPDIFNILEMTSKRRNVIEFGLSVAERSNWKNDWVNIIHLVDEKGVEGIGLLNNSKTKESINGLESLSRSLLENIKPMVQSLKNGQIENTLKMLQDTQDQKDIYEQQLHSSRTSVGVSDRYSLETANPEEAFLYAFLEYSRFSLGDKSDTLSLVKLMEEYAPLQKPTRMSDLINKIKLAITPPDNAESRTVLRKYDNLTGMLSVKEQAVFNLEEQQLKETGKRRRYD